MYEITSGSREVDRVQVETFKREIYNCNILSVEAGSYSGRDSGDHGAQLYIRIQDEGGTQWEINPYTTSYGCEGIEIKMCGTSELETMIEALKFITQALEEGAKDA